MAVMRMDNMGIVVEDLGAAIEFFTELGLELEGRMPVQGEWAEGVTGLRDMQVEIAMMRTPEPIGWDETTTTAAAVPEEAPVEEEASTLTAH